MAPNRVKTTLKSPGKLSTRDQQELASATENDLTAKSDQSSNEARSKMFEDFVCNYLSRNHIRFRRQEEVGAEQTKQHGNAVATPDILLDEPIFINDTKIGWIDAKNSYGADCSLTRDRVAKQVTCFVPSTDASDAPH
jgi:hypothetical protein